MGRPTQHLQILDTWPAIMEILALNGRSGTTEALTHEGTDLKSPGTATSMNLKCNHKTKEKHDQDDPRLRRCSSTKDLLCTHHGNLHVVYGSFPQSSCHKSSISGFHGFFFGGWHRCPNLPKIGFQICSNWIEPDDSKYI